MSDDLQLLLDAARAAPPSPTVDAEVRMRHAVLVAGPIAGAGTLTKPAAAAARALLTKTVLGLAILAVTGGAVLAVMHRAVPAGAPKVSAAPPVPVVAPNSPLAVVATEAAAPAEPLAPAGVASRPLRAQRVAPPAVHAAAENEDVAPTAAAPTATSATVISAPSIAAEIKALDEALVTVDAGRWAQALDLLARYRASFPRGVLATEARTLEVLALCGLDRTDEAKALGRGLLDEAAASPSLMRLRHSCIAP